MLVVIDHQESAFIKLMIIRRGRQYKKSDHRSDRFCDIAYLAKAISTYYAAE
jgi:hypothetical protein